MLHITVHKALLPVAATAVIMSRSRQRRCVLCCRPSSDAGSAFDPVAAADRAEGSSPPTAAGVEAGFRPSSSNAKPPHADSRAKELARKGLAGLSRWREKASSAQRHV